MVSFTPRLLFPRGKNQGYPLDRRMGWSQSQPEGCEEEKSPLCVAVLGSFSNSHTCKLHLTVWLILHYFQYLVQKVMKTRPLRVKAGKALLILWELISMWLSGIAPGHGLCDSGFESRQGMGIFLLTSASRPTQPPIQRVLGAPSLGAKRPEREAYHSHSPTRPHGVALSWSTGTILLLPLPSRKLILNVYLSSSFKLILTCEFIWDGGVILEEEQRLNVCWGEYLMVMGWSKAIQNTYKYVIYP
jgi:hypothetical protein